MKYREIHCQVTHKILAKEGTVRTELRYDFPSVYLQPVCDVRIIRRPVSYRNLRQVKCHGGKTVVFPEPQDRGCA